MTISWRYETVQTTESTNSDLLHRWHQKSLIEPISLMAYEQTAGYGKRGKSWIAEKDNSLTFSLAYPFHSQFSMMKLQGLTLVCGLTILQGLMEYLQISTETAKTMGFGLKWPNDILLNHRKVGGILVEGGQKSSAEPIWMIIGIGLNVNLARRQTENLETANIGELNIKHIPLEIEALWKFLSEKIGQALEIFSANSFRLFQEDWNTWDCWRDKNVFINHKTPQEHYGKNIGINHLGYLMLQTDLGIQEIISGDLSLAEKTI
jgi:BirA family transcriptional regulator, biotin operon repressor / biotin---[acetyl-CoA-carboxylase] ligase